MPNTASRRPKHLPDFKNPPLSEVAIGVQFAPPKDYQQILAGEVWNLFRKEYPKAIEQEPIPPSFETFGLPMPAGQPRKGQLNIVTGASHDRFWFLRPDGAELVQFQNDRLIHNWRKLGDSKNKYPRFERMVHKFERQLNQLQNYMNALTPQTLIINQCEISYINNIIIDEEDGLKPSDWLRFFTFGDNTPDDFRIGFRETLYDEAKKPEGRFIAETVSALNRERKQMIIFTLTVRGAPKEPKIESALDFISKGRQLIINKFTELTTDYAHIKWGRCK